PPKDLRCCFGLQCETLHIQLGFDDFVAQSLIKAGLQTDHEILDCGGADDGIQALGIEPFHRKRLPLPVVDERPKTIDVEIEGADRLAVHLHNYSDFRWQILPVGLTHTASSSSGAFPRLK